MDFKGYVNLVREKILSTGTWAHVGIESPWIVQRYVDQLSEAELEVMQTRLLKRLKDFDLAYGRLRDDLTYVIQSAHNWWELTGYQQKRQEERDAAERLRRTL